MLERVSPRFDRQPNAAPHSTMSASLLPLLADREHGHAAPQRPRPEYPDALSGLAMYTDARTRRGESAHRRLRRDVRVAAATDQTTI